MSTNESMTQERLDAIQERVDAATPGPLEWLDASNLVTVNPDEYGLHTSVIEGGEVFGRSNADLIAHAPDDLADLLAEVERLRALTIIDKDMLARAQREYEWSGNIRHVLHAALGAGEGA